MIILQANKLERSFSGEVLFQNINLQIDERDRIALVGRNGAGKSTLLKILVDEETPSSGQVIKKRDLSLSYLAQNSQLESNQTIFEAMLEVFTDLQQQESQLRHLEGQMSELTGQELADLMQRYDQLSEDFRVRGGFTYDSDIKAMLNGFKFDQSMWDLPVSDLSGGQKTRLALAKMLLEKPELLVLDEPTNHLDIDTVAWLENYLVNYQGALLIVSHDRYFLDKVATKTADLRPHTLEIYAGNYSKFMTLKAEKLATEQKNFDKQSKEIAKLEDFVKRNIARASTTKRAQSRRKQLEKMERLEKPELADKSAVMTFQADKSSGNQVLQLEAAAIGYDKEMLAQQIELDLRKYDAVALVGPNGIGKSTLLKTLVGELELLAGTVQYGANVKLGYYDQNQSALTSSHTVLEELWSAFPTTPEVAIRNRLGAFLFSGDEVKKTVGMLSGGEKARLLLAKLSMENNNLLILDEPTNHLDIESKEVLENALIDFDGTLLFVSHDRYFINRVATKVVELSASGSQLYLGDYDYYLEKKAEQLDQSAPESQVVEPTAQQGDYQQQKLEQKERRKKERQLAQVEADLSSLENDIEQINQAMLTTNDADDLMELQGQLDHLTSQQDDLLASWERLAEELD
ncbi:ABC transporter ATP-binding protein [Streptococcus cuniculipharyngis]|uniref:ABC-F family ATP-binding cassette domain-containing protein n=1 Tax=Streptococcus cuniculipharyngis TaxID=1562651 RepID=A0A5C5SGC9_9STRE|nr:ABC-F family ATP-binding cassette domain-containing protein [Streptococcus cuniculipharyngis]TWS99193.1 ABC-F family ATP-binding cassette domain-containing protein [Streptococcus cuniculipharyngis]